MCDATAKGVAATEPEGMQGPAPGTLRVHHSSAANPTWPGGTPPAYPMGRDVAQQGTDWSPPHPVVPVALVHSPPASRVGAQAAVRFHSLALGTVTEVDGTVFSWHSGPHDLPQNPTPANRPADVTPSLTRSKAEACKRSLTTAVTHHPQGNRHNPLESYLEASSPSSPKLRGTSRGAGCPAALLLVTTLGKGWPQLSPLLLGPPDTSLGCRRCSAASPQRQGWSASPRDGPVPPQHPPVPHPVPMRPRGAPRTPQLVSSGAQPSLGTPLQCPISLSPRRRTAELAPDMRPKGCGISETRGDDYEMPRGRTKRHQGRPALPVLLLPGSVWAGFLVLLRRDGVRLSRAM